MFNSLPLDIRKQNSRFLFRTNSLRNILCVEEFVILIYFIKFFNYVLVLRLDLRF